jgi:transcriptional regulator with XRE-family HTH domain
MTMEMQQLKAIGEQVVDAREALGWSQTELAARTGFTDSTIRKVENGVRVSPGTLRRVLDEVGIEPASEQKKVVYPRDVQAMLDLMGMYLVAIPEGERTEVMYDVTRYLLGRQPSQGAESAGFVESAERMRPSE